MSTAEASASVKKEDQEISGNPKGGELLFCGATMWEAAGRKNVDFSSTNLVSPVRLTSLMGINITFVAAGCASNHCVALDVEGRCYTWGRNDKGQLGHGDLVQRDKPTLVSGLSNLKIVKAGGGKHHTVVVAADESSFTFGWNKHGQLGTGSTKNEVESSPVRCLVTQVTNAVCGADFTLWLSTVPGSTILTAGLPQYGQLGHGTDNESQWIQMGFVYTWGYGGYGRLGHREQKDEWTPRLVEMFQRSNVLPPTAVVAAGSAHSACTAGGGQLYMWGRVKQTGDNWMYPKPVFDLSGWNIRCIDFGYTHNICGADDSCIGWGVSQNGELGFGPLGPKSSANPKKIDILDGMHVLSVACGFSHSLIVVDRTILADRIEKLEIFDGERPSQDDIEVEEEVPAKNTPVSKSGKKRKGASDDVPVEASVKSEKKPRKKASKKKYSSNSDNSDDDGGDDDDTFSEEDANGSSKSHSKSRGRGRGRGASRGASTGRGKSSRGRGKGKGAKSGKAR